MPGEEQLLKQWLQHPYLYIYTCVSMIVCMYSTKEMGVNQCECKYV